MIRRNRSSGSRLSLSKPKESNNNDGNSTTFDDEENVIITILIALHDHILTNTASTGPTMDAKNRVWDLIRDRLCKRIGAIIRTDEQVRNRWKTLRSSYTFKQDKAQHLAEMFYKRLPLTHKIRLKDISVPGIQFPEWLQNMIKDDPNFNPENCLDSEIKNDQSTNPNTLKKKQTSTSITKRQTPLNDKIKDEINPPKKRKITRNSTSKKDPQLIDQDTNSNLFKRFPVDTEDIEKGDNSTPISSLIQEELNSVTESGVNTPTNDDYETEAEANYRRHEEIHKAKLALLNAKRKEVDARLRFTELQMQLFIAQNASLFNNNQNISMIDTVNNIEVLSKTKESLNQSDNNMN